MREERVKLETLQTIDGIILDVKEEMEGLNGKVAKYTALIETTKKEEEDNLQKLKLLEAGKGDLDKMLFIEQEKLKKFRTRLQGQGVKNPHTIAANQKEIEKSKKDVETIESDIIKKMQEIEAMKTTIEAIKAKHAEAQKNLDESREESQRRSSELDEKLKSKKAEREKLVGDIPQNILSVYNRILTKFPRTPLAGAFNEFCLACHMHIPPQLYNELKRADKLITCPNCRRVLFFKEPVEETSEKAVQG